MVAHRAGNCLDALREAERLGVALVEADVRLFRGRAEIRHLKTVGLAAALLGPVGVASPFRRSLVLSELLRRDDSGTELMLDLKGSERRLAEIVREELAPYLGARRFIVCARSWELLDAFDGLPVRRVASVGSRRQLRALIERFAGARLDGVSIHERLLDRARRRRAPRRRRSDPHVARERARARPRAPPMGVDGLISDRADAIAPLAAAAA